MRIIYKTQLFHLFPFSPRRLKFPSIALFAPFVESRWRTSTKYEDIWPIIVPFLREGEAQRVFAFFAVPPTEPRPEKREDDEGGGR